MVPRSLITSEKNLSKLHKFKILSIIVIKIIFLHRFSPNFHRLDHSTSIAYCYIHTASSNLKPLRNARSVVNVNLIKRTL